MISPLENTFGLVQQPELSEDRRIGPGNSDGSRGLAISARPDRVSISEEAREKALAMMGKKAEKAAETGKTEKGMKGPAGELSEEEKKQVQELKKRDREVRAHEMAHMSASGGHALGGPSYEYQRGPDGVNYAVGGEVAIDTSPVRGDPRATIAKAQTIKAAAMAPAEPSGADRAVAAAAAAMEAQARAQLSEQTVNEQDGNGPGTENRINGAGNDDKRGSIAAAQRESSDDAGKSRAPTSPFGVHGDDRDHEPVLNLMA